MVFGETITKENQWKEGGTETIKYINSIYSSKVLFENKNFKIS